MYSSVLITGVNVLFMDSFSTLDVDSDAKTTPLQSRTVQLGMTGLAFGIAVLTLFIYAGILRLGVLDPERAAHFCEFADEILNGVFALSYGIVCYTGLQRKLEGYSYSASNKKYLYASERMPLLV